MVDYDPYDFTIHSEEELLRTIREVREQDYPVFLYINGIYYDFSSDYESNKG